MTYLQGDPAPAGLQALISGRSSAPVELPGGSIQASGLFTFVDNFTAEDVITVDGVAFTAKASGAAGAEFNIAGSLSLSLDALVTVLNASVDADVAKATYAKSGTTKLLVTHDEGGVVGNAFTIAKTLTSTAATISGATLSGGVDQDIPDREFVYFNQAGTPVQYYFLREAPELEGTKRTLALKAKGTGDAVVYADFDGGTKITFDTAGKYAVLQYLGGEWKIVKNTGTLA